MVNKANAVNNPEIAFLQLMLFFDELALRS
jgi:hypothetical protein